MRKINFVPRLRGNIRALLKTSPSRLVQDKANDLELDITVLDDIEGFEAYTDGVKITVKAPEKLIHGVAFHELGHLLFTDFRSLRLLSASAACSYFERPLRRYLTKEEYDMLDNLFRSGKRGLTLNLLARYNNILEDGYLERALINKYKIMLTKALIYVRMFFWKDFNSIQEIQDGLDNGGSKINALFTLTLAYAKYGKLKRDSNKELELDIAKEFASHYGFIKDIVRTHNKEERFIKTLALFAKVYVPLIDSIEEEAPPDDFVSPEDINNAESDVSQGVRSIFEDEEKPLGDIEEKEGDSISDESLEDYQEDSDFASEKEEQDKIFDELEKEIEKEVKKVKQKSKDKKDEDTKEDAKELQEVLDDTLSSEDYHRDIKKVITIPRENKKMYLESKQGSSKASKALALKFKTMFETFKRNQTKRGLWYGGRLTTKTAHRPDVGYFKRDISYSKDTDLAIFLLVDESGSMCFMNRELFARKAAIFIDEAARTINLPLAIYGHHEDFDSHELELLQYKGFEETDEDVKYRLGSITSRDENRDGAAIRFALEILRQRPEQKKLLLVISDGLPSAYNYRIESGKKDIQKCIKDYPEVDIVAAAIGDSKPAISSIYGEERFLDITDLNTLGDKLFKIITKKLV